MNYIPSNIQRMDCSGLPSGMNVPRMSTLNSKLPSLIGNPCICNRQIAKVLCTMCGYLLKGRARLNCPRHPNVVHLMDVTNCPNCKGDRLKEFDCTPKRK